MIIGLFAVSWPKAEDLGDIKQDIVATWKL